MTLPQMVRSFTRITLCTTLVCSAAAQAPSKPLITNKYDLPRFSYPVQGSVEQLLSLPAKDFVLLAQPAIADLTRMMRDYQVEDHATLALLLKTKLNFAILSEDDAAAMKLIPQIRALQEKPGEKLVGDLVQEAFLRSRQSAGSTHATDESCPLGYQETYRAMAQSMPWTTVSASLEEQKRRAEIVTKPFFMGLAEARLGPVVNKEHALTLDEMKLLMEDARFKANLRNSSHYSMPNDRRRKESKVSVVPNHVSGRRGGAGVLIDDDKRVYEDSSWLLRANSFVCCVSASTPAAALEQLL